MTMANSGETLPSAPVTEGPTRRLASNVSSVTAAGNRQPETANSRAPEASKPPVSSIAGASRSRATSVLGTLTEAPRNGDRWRRPSWVSTSDSPRQAAAHRESAATSRPMIATGALALSGKGRHHGLFQAGWPARTCPSPDGRNPEGRTKRQTLKRKGAGGRAVHDVGGLEFGPIDRHEHDLALWEKRTDAMLLLLGRRASAPSRSTACAA